MKQALGLVEIQGLTIAVAAADSMVKAANIRLLEIENSKGLGYMTIKVTGDVGAVNAAVSVGRQIGAANQKLVSWKVIPRPSDYVEQTFCTPKPPSPPGPKEEPDSKPEIESEPEKPVMETKDEVRTETDNRIETDTENKKAGSIETEAVKKETETEVEVETEAETEAAESEKDITVAKKPASAKKTGLAKRKDLNP